MKTVFVLFSCAFLLLTINVSAQFERTDRMQQDRLNQQQLPNKSAIQSDNMNLQKDSSTMPGARGLQKDASDLRTDTMRDRRMMDRADTNRLDTETRTWSGRERDSIARDRFAIGFGFSRDDFILAPRDRFVVFNEVATRVPNIAVIAEKIRLVEPACLFPNEGYFTLFLPQDNAVRQEIILASSDPVKLCDFLKQFIVPDLVQIESITAPMNLKTLAGTELHLEKRQGELLINGVRILKPNAVVGKGVVIHVTDKVIGKF